MDQVFELEGKTWFNNLDVLPQETLEGMIVPEPKTVPLEGMIVPQETSINPDEFYEYIKYDLIPNNRYEDWRTVGFALSHTFGKEGFTMFNDYSKKNISK